ncbi:MAG TPA: AAA family ATPase, partial [Acidimicrobiia bacterium]|nr:AAA family ATPase [Acidimicrobiia bacterium]
MQLAHLWLTDFRGHQESEVEVGPGITVFAGGNAQGKTSVLEAVGWLARMSSFRGAPDSALVRVGCEKAIVRAEIVPANRGPDVRPDLIEAEIAAAGRNRVLLNRKPLPRARDLLGSLRTTVFAPDDLRLVKAGPAERRA